MGTEKKNELMTAREKELEKKKKEKEEKKAKLEEQKIKSSLFQRLFQRSQSRPTEDGEAEAEGEGDQEMVDASASLPPPPPPHQPSYLSQVSIDAQLNDLEQLIQCGELERLDSVVTEFTSQYPAESSKQDQPSPTVQT